MWQLAHSKEHYFKPKLQELSQVSLELIWVQPILVSQPWKEALLKSLKTLKVKEQLLQLSLLQMTLRD